MKKLLCILALLLALVCVFAACETEMPRSITKSEVVNGELVITYSDGTTENLGKVVGDKGDTGATGAQGPRGENGDSGLGDSENPQGLDFYPLPDGTYVVSAGNAIYLEEVTIPATYHGKPVTCIGLPEGTDHDLGEVSGNFGFAQAPYLKKITLPETITYIGEDAFNSCENLTEINLPNSLTGIGEDAFGNCDKLNYAVYMGAKYLGNTENPYLYLASAGDATDLVLASTALFFDEDAFRGSTALKSVTLPSKATKISSSMFSNCTALESVTIPSGVTEIESYAFRNCSSLVSVTIPNSVTSVGDSAFYGCSSLVSVTIPNSVTSVGDSAFCGCSSLAMVIFEEGSQLEKIQSNTFAQTALTSIIIPSRVNYLYANAFYNCKMMQVTFENTSGWFVAYGESTTGAALDVSDPALNAYKLTGYRNPYPPADGEDINVDRDNLGNGPKIWKRN